MTTAKRYRPRFESLETRRCMAASLGVEVANQSSSNTDSAQESSVVDQHDTNRDGKVTSLDALVVINYLGREGEPESIDGHGHLDANGDGRVSALDALVVVNRLGQIVPDDPDSDSFTNPGNRFDVNDSGDVNSDDVDLIYTALERFGVTNVAGLPIEEVGFIDVNSDGELSAADALAVINHLGEDGDLIPDDGAEVELEV